MNLFFEESGDFKVGTVLSQAGEAYQVELASGKRTKVKAKDVLIQFEKPDPETLLANARGIAAEVDLDFLWEVAGQDEFGIPELGLEYFGHAPLPSEAAGLVLALHGAPVYFHKKGRGRYKAAPEQTLKAALAGIEKKKQQAIVQAGYVEELKAGTLPASMQPIVQQLLFKPDKNTIEYKALEAAANELHTTAPRLMLATRGLGSPKELHMARFLFEYFPRGAGFAPVGAGGVPLPAAPLELPLADVAAFSIDDVTTTEIDDAFSVVKLDDGTVRVGIHIAAPGLAIRPDDAIDKIARARMSTVYMPGDKITMLPDEVVEAFTLAEGKDCPALSLYAVINPEDWSLVSTTTRAERVPIRSNLRHNDLDALVNEETLASGEGEYPHKDELGLLWKWALQLEAGRMKKREAFGLKPEQANRVDFNFYVEDDVVSIVRRKRGAPLDKIVAELMIFANSTWGKLLHDSDVPGIYRSQGPGAGGWGAKIQVRMVTHAAPHQGLGVDQYAWSTSPLRRYTDLVNQWQIIACAEHGVTAPLVAPFKPRDATLFSIVSAFDAAYAAYNDFQQNMERYWCLRWLGQTDAKHVDAVVLKDEIVRLVDVPLVVRLAGMSSVARGAQVKLDIVRWDEVDLVLEARLLEVAAAAPDESIGLEEEEEGDTGEAAVAEVVEAEGVVAVVTTEDGGELPTDAGTE
ncbi:ribonuclease catalytic domain-containing protein [Telluria aromaticivorans]|uniref:RNB domain-containing ribonuclease n=1 Tax=Telluria aromaticivorans TaxID=2725995 RepID=A0A7Y2NZH4_9BURK|nr:RNB domain-containing ribonuclease [Telluria aromaticivorans]NNG23079.1 RNB domain-containing ribonuclease [Telluria aromaticivorans]